MSGIDDETLMAFVDGELGEARAAEIAAQVAADPELAAHVERFKRTQAALKAAYAPVLDEPVPDRLLAALRGESAPTTEVLDFAAAKAAREAAKPAAFKLLNWTALAATLLVGVIAGKFVEIGPQPLIGGRGGALTAGGKLETALNDQLASDPATGTVRIGLSFREGDGTYCRTFRVVKGDAVAGIACRQSDGWGVRLAVAAGPLQGADYRMASSDTPPAVLAAVAGMIKGEALDAPAEMAARDKGWK